MMNVAHELILVIDDHRIGLELTRQILLGAGFLVMTADSAEAALTIMTIPRDQPLPDLIVLDLNLPRMSGLEFAQKLRSVGCEIPIIAHTAFSTMDWDFPQAAYAAGCNAFVEKRGDLDVLPRAVALFLQRGPPNRRDREKPKP